MNTQEATIPSGNCTPGRPERANFFFGPTFDSDSEHRPFSECATGGRELGLGRLDTGALNSSWEVYIKIKTEGKEPCLSRSPWPRGLEDARRYLYQ